MRRFIKKCHGKTKSSIKCIQRNPKWKFLSKVSRSLFGSFTLPESAVWLLIRQFLFRERGLLKKKKGVYRTPGIGCSKVDVSSQLGETFIYRFEHFIKQWRGAYGKSLGLWDGQGAKSVPSWIQKRPCLIYSFMLTNISFFFLSLWIHYVENLCS